MMQLLRQFLFLCARFDIAFTPVWIPSEDNPLADAASSFLLYLTHIALASIPIPTRYPFLYHYLTSAPVPTFNSPRLPSHLLDKYPPFPSSSPHHFSYCSLPHSRRSVYSPIPGSARPVIIIVLPLTSPPSPCRPCESH
ncbi:hypothetical protein R3P38DRAFT_2860811, partial [Favolaschia claudopus]